MYETAGGRAAPKLIAGQNLGPKFWINVRDPLYFLGYGIPYIYVKRILFSH